ncbi:MAG: hypothetical protein EOM52_04875 [Clostridia bacterium]|nr:hypothetical protein [Clostridia bacterium]
MTEAFLTCWDGTRFSLPALVSWRFEYTAGVPCDSFFVKCLWEPGMEQVLSDAVEFAAEENGETVFRGVVDEFETRWDGDGGALTLAGRGMAARLLDNEAEGADYLTATEEDILRDHVLPYGVEVGDRGMLPAVSNFTVHSGSSEWNVLYSFARYYGGVTPRFDRTGKLVLSPWGDTKVHVVSDAVAATEFLYRERRYGVLSEILVRDKTRFAVERVENERFAGKGGRCRRVMTMPGRTAYQAMRYSGAYQLKRSESEWIRAEITIPRLFFAWPGDLVKLEKGGFGKNGVYRVLEAVVTADGAGGRTRLVLGERDAVI